jgi:hypothetical protein
MKKLLLMAIVAGTLAFAATPSQAGVSVGIGIGFPIGYGYGYGYGYPYYGYPGYYPYYRPYYAPVVYVGPSFYWHHGHRVYYSRHHRYHRY